MIAIVTTNFKEARVEGLKLHHLKRILNALEKDRGDSLADDFLINVFRMDIGRIEARKELA